MTWKLNGPKIWALLPIALVFAGLLSGCERVSTGSDIPVTKERLVSTRLTDIKRKVSWTFSNATVVIDNEEQSLPSDIVAILKLEPATVYRRVEANWELDETAGFLLLSQITADGEAIDNPLKLPVAPAGQIRVNLAGRQYNMFAVPDGGE